MEDKNIALLGFVSSAADYLKKQIKDDSEEIKKLDEIDLDKIKDELHNRLGSSFGGVQDKSNDLINAGREAFNDFINNSSDMIDEFNDIFNVDFKKENDEKDEEMVNHLISILREPNRFDNCDDYEIQIAKAANDSFVDDNKKVEVACNDNEELDSLFSEIIANENIKVEEPVLNTSVEVLDEEKAELDNVVDDVQDAVFEEKEINEEKTEEKPQQEVRDNGLDAEEIKKLIKDTISEFFINNEKHEEKEVNLDEIIDSFDVLKNVGNEEKPEDKEDDDLDTLCAELDSVEYEELNPNNNSLLDGVFKRVDEFEEVKDESACLDDDSSIEDINSVAETDVLNKSIDDEGSDSENVSEENISENDVAVSLDENNTDDSKKQEPFNEIVIEKRVEEPIVEIEYDLDDITKELEDIIVTSNGAVEPVDISEDDENIKTTKVVVEDRIEEPTIEIGSNLDDIVARLEKIIPPTDVVITDEDDHKVVIEKRVEEPTIDISNDLDDIVNRLENIIPKSEPIVEDDSNKEELFDQLLDILDSLNVDEDSLEEKANTDDSLDLKNDEISLFDDENIPLSKRIGNYADSDDKDDETSIEYEQDENKDDEGMFSSFLKELKNSDDNQEKLVNEEENNQSDDYGMKSLSDILDQNDYSFVDDETSQESEIVDNDYLEAYNNRSLEELYIPNPGLDALDQEEVVDEPVQNDVVSEADDKPVANDDDYLEDLFAEFTNNEYEVDDFKNKQQRINELNKKIYDSIVALYPYLSNGFIKGVYELKESFASDYKEGEKIIILHRLVFTSLDGLRGFVDVMMSHDYFVNVDEKQMIVDTFKEHVNSDGKILTDIFEVANQAKLLTGEYEGYRIIEVDN